MALSLKYLPIGTDIVEPIVMYYIENWFILFPLTEDSGIWWNPCCLNNNGARTFLSEI